MEGKFIEDEVAGETAGGAGIGGENLDAAGFVVAENADFQAHVVISEVGGLVLGLEFGVVEAADLGAFGDELGAVVAGVGEDGDEAAGARRGGDPRPRRPG